MEISYKFNTDNALDRQVLEILNKTITFIEVKQEDGATADKPAETATTKPETTKPKTEKQTKSKRKAREKTKDQLLKLNVDTMIEYLKSRGAANPLECKMFAKMTIDEYQCMEDVTSILHELGANNFGELKQHTQFAGGLMKLVAAKKAEVEAVTTKPEESNDDSDIFG